MTLVFHILLQIWWLIFTILRPLIISKEHAALPESQQSIILNAAGNPSTRADRAMSRLTEDYITVRITEKDGEAREVPVSMIPTTLRKECAALIIEAAGLKEAGAYHLADTHSAETAQRHYALDLNHKLTEEADKLFAKFILKDAPSMLDDRLKRTFSDPTITRAMASAPKVLRSAPAPVSSSATSSSTSSASSLSSASSSGASSSSSSTAVAQSDLLTAHPEAQALYDSLNIEEDVNRQDRATTALLQRKVVAICEVLDTPDSKVAAGSGLYSLPMTPGGTGSGPNSPARDFLTSNTGRFSSYAGSPLRVQSVQSPIRLRTYASPKSMSLSLRKSLPLRPTPLMPDDPWKPLSSPALVGPARPSSAAKLFHIKTGTPQPIIDRGRRSLPPSAVDPKVLKRAPTGTSAGTPSPSKKIVRGLGTILDIAARDLHKKDGPSVRVRFSVAEVNVIYTFVCRLGRAPTAADWRQLLVDNRLIYGNVLHERRSATDLKDSFRTLRKGQYAITIGCPAEWHQNLEKMLGPL
jgi:hypothetical protein